MDNVSICSWQVANVNTKALNWRGEGYLCNAYVILTFQELLSLSLVTMFLYDILSG